MRKLHFTGSVKSILEEFGRLEMRGDDTLYDEGECFEVYSTTDNKTYKLRYTKSKETIIRLLTPFKYLTRNIL